MSFKTHFDGTALMPDEVVTLEQGVTLVMSVRPAKLTGKGKTGKEPAGWLLTESHFFDTEEDVDELKRRIEEGRKPRYQL